VFFGDSSNHQVYLTFDDGPHPEVTPKLLDILDEYQAQASFFVLASDGGWWKELIREIHRRGHIIGMHGLRHQSNYYHSNSQLIGELRQLSGMIISTGVPLSAIFRPPFGHVRPDTILALRKKGIRTILWSRIPGDYRQIEPLELFAKASNELHPGEIVVLHDGTKLSPAPVLDVTPRLLNFIRERGWTCSALQYKTYRPNQ
jgi:peptidoglycan-N-acetylglucosamine deacetylase